LTATVTLTSLPGHELARPYDYGPAFAPQQFANWWLKPGQSVERRSSGALSAFAGSALVSDLTGSSLALSTAGVSTRADI